MARYINNPNPYSKTLNRKFTHRFLVLLAFVGGMALAYWLSKVSNIFVALLGYAFILAFVLIAHNIVKQMGKNDRGEAGEGQVKKLLMSLSDEYTVFQNVPILNRLDIDFIVVGPVGVFAIEVKSHKGFNILLRNKFISQTFAETMGLKEYLKKSGVDVYVQAALVFTGTYVRYSPPRKGVHVVNKDYLLPLLDRSRKISFNKENTVAIISKLYN